MSERVLKIPVCLTSSGFPPPVAQEGVVLGFRVQDFGLQASGFGVDV